MHINDARAGNRGALQLAAATVLLAFIGGCGGGDSTGTSGSTGFVGDKSTLTISPTNLTVVQGKSATATLTLVRTGSAAQGATVNFAVQGLSKGLTATFNPPSLPPGTSSTTVTIAAASDADVVTGAQPFFVALVGSDTLGITGGAPSLTVTVRNGRPGVAVQKAGAGTGTVTSNPAGINCGPTCNSAFDALTPITFTAAPAAGSAFTSWTGSCTGTALTCTFTPNDFGNLVTATFSSTVSAIGLFVSPSPLTVQAGGASASATITLARINGFADPVTLAVNAPSGLTVSASPTSITGTTSTLTVSAAASLPSGNYPVTVTGTATGVTQQTATFAVQVTPAAGGGPTMFNYATCETNQTPVWFAVQNGSGPWTQATLANNAVTFTINSVGAVAYVVKDGTNMTTTVLYGSAAEIAQVAAANPCGGAPTGTKRITGSFNASGDSTNTVNVVVGGATFVKPVNSSGLTMTNVPKGPRELISTRTSLAAPGTDQMILRRNTNYANNANIPTLDFSNANTTDGFTPVYGGIVIPNLGTDQGESQVSLITVNGPSDSYFSYSGPPGPSVGFPFMGLPDARLQAGDFHQVSVFAAPSSGGNSYRFIDAMQHSPSVQTISLGPQVGAAAKVTTLGTSPYLRLRAQIPSQSTYSAGAAADYSQNSNSVSLMMTAAYAGAVPATWTLDIPDLSGAGYNTAWALSGGTGVSWNVIAAGGNVLPFVGGNPVDNAQIVGAGAMDSASTFASASKRRFFGRLHR
jgi:Divergent InlB B-repeat domain